MKTNPIRESSIAMLPGEARERHQAWLKSPTMFEFCQGLGLRLESDSDWIYTFSTGTAVRRLRFRETAPSKKQFDQIMAEFSYLVKSGKTLTVKKYSSRVFDLISQMTLSSSPA